MSNKCVIALLAATLLIAGLGFWLFGMKRWSGEQLEAHRFTDSIELAIAEFRHPDSEVIRITAVWCEPKNNEIAIDFGRLEQASSPINFVMIADRNTVAMINGGYFDSSFQPVGLVVQDGHTISEISKQPAISGVFAIYDDGSVALIPRESYLADDSIDSAIQAGPFIVDPGGRAGIRSDDLKKAKRTAIGQTIEGEIVFITTSPCTLFELSEILTRHPGKLGVTRFDRVLNLDGGPSTGLYLRGLEEHRVVPETAMPNMILMRSR